MSRSCMCPSRFFLIQIHITRRLLMMRIYTINCHCSLTKITTKANLWISLLIERISLINAWSVKNKVFSSQNKTYHDFLANKIWSWTKQKQASFVVLEALAFACASPKSKCYRCEKCVLHVGQWLLIVNHQ